MANWTIISIRTNANQVANKAKIENQRHKGKTNKKTAETKTKKKK